MKSIIKQKKHTSLIILLFILFVSRIIYIIISSPVKLAGDAGAYDKSAIDLLAGNGYIWDGWHLQVPPFYSLFLAFIYGVFFHSPALICILQAMFDVITGIIIFLIAKQEFKNPPAGMFAVAMMIIYPTLYCGVVYLGTYTLFMMLLVCTVFVFLKAIRTEKSGLFILSGLLLGITTLTRTTAFLLWVPMFIYALFVWRKRNFKKLLLFVPFILTMFLVITPWGMYNYKTQGKFVFTSLNMGYALWLTSAPKGDKSYADLPGTAKYKIYQTEFRKLPEIQANEIFLKKGLHNIKTHPKDYFFTVITNIGRLYINFPYSKPPSIFTMFYMALNLIIILFAVKGFFLNWRQNLFVGLCICYFTAVHTLCHIAGYFYNMQTVPFLLLLASLSITNLPLLKKLFSGRWSYSPSFSTTPVPDKTTNKTTEQSGMDRKSFSQN